MKGRPSLQTRHETIRHAERGYLIRGADQLPVALARAPGGRVAITGVDGEAPEPPPLLYINGMQTTLDGAREHAALIAGVAGEPVLMLYNGRNALPDSILAWLGVADSFTRLLADLIDRRLDDRAPLIVVAQSLGTLKLQNAAREVFMRRLARGAGSREEAGRAAHAALRRMTCIFTGNVVARPHPILHGYVVYNHGDPLAGLLGTRVGTPTLRVVPIARNPAGSFGGPHRFTNHLPAVAALIRMLRARAREVSHAS